MKQFLNKCEHPDPERLIGHCIHSYQLGTCDSEVLCEHCNPGVKIESDDYKAAKAKGGKE